MHRSHMLLVSLFVLACDEPEPDPTSCPPYRTGDLGSELPLYDDFSDALLDPAKWENLERVGEIRDGALYLMARHAYGGPETKGGRWVSAPGSWSHIEADVTIVDHAQTGGQVRTVMGFAYQPEAVPLDGTNLHRTYARIQIFDNGDGLKPKPVVLTCLDATCTTKENAVLLSETGDPWPNWASEDTTYRASVRFQDDSDTFVLTLDGSTATFDTSNLSHFDPADLRYTMLLAQVREMTAPGDDGSMAAAFDNIVIDDTAYDDFDGGPRLDPAKWTQLEFSREVIDGELSIRHTLADASPWESGRSARALDPTVHDAIHARVAVDVLDGEVWLAHSRVGGAFYNDGSAGDGLGGLNGNVVGELGLYEDQAKYYVFRCASADCETRETLSTNAAGAPGRMPMGEVSLGEAHDLFLQFDGEHFAFQLDDDPVMVFDPASAGAAYAAAAQDPFLQVGSRCVVDEGEYCYQEARFDDVRLGPAVSLCPEETGAD